MKSHVQIYLIFIQVQILWASHLPTYTHRVVSMNVLSMNNKNLRNKLKKNITHCPTLWEPSIPWHHTENDLYVLQTCLTDPIIYRKSQIIWSQTNCQLLAMVRKPDINQSVFIRGALRFSCCAHLIIWPSCRPDFRSLRNLMTKICICLSKMHTVKKLDIYF